MEASNQSSPQNAQDLAHSDCKPYEDIYTLLFADFRGMDDQTLQKLQEILNDIKNGDKSISSASPPIITLLLHGPPGCGKTKLAQTIGHGLGLPFYLVQSTPRIRREVLQGIFRNACHNAPSIIFIDDLQVMGSMRADPKVKKEKQTVQNLIACIQESTNALRSRTNNQCYVLLIAATNKVEVLDSKLVNSYFNQQIYIGIPNEDARWHILSKLTKDMRLDENIDITEIARITSGYVWADLEDLVHEAGKCCTTRFRSEIEEKLSDEVKRTWWLTTLPPEINKKHCISTADFLEAATSIRPSLGDDA